MISQFEGIVKEDFQQFRDISQRFQDIRIEDADGLYQLSIDSWLLATRWSEIQSNASKIAQQYGIKKTDFGEWAYQKYRQLQEMHITCRSWFRLAKEDMKLNNMIEGI